MKNVADRIKNVITYSEMEAAKAIISKMEGKDQAILITSKIADTVGITRSVIVSALKLLEVGGIVETRSLGMKGTSIRVTDREVVNQLMAW